MKVQAMIQPALVFQVIVVPGPGVVVFPDPKGVWWSMEVEHQRIALPVCVE
jgi:hypothetical protein